MDIASRTKAEDMTGHRKCAQHTRFGEFVLVDRRYIMVYKMKKNYSPLCFDDDETSFWPRYTKFSIAKWCTGSE